MKYNRDVYINIRINHHRVPHLMYAWEPRHAKTCQDNWEVRWSSLSQSCGTGGKSGAFAGGFRPAMVIPRKEKNRGMAQAPIRK